jgi:two-component system cell cycle sensor histidine kinase/response regulator CckA
MAIFELKMGYEKALLESNMESSAKTNAPIQAMPPRRGDLQSRLDASLAAERRLRAIIEKAAGMVTLRDAQNKLLYASPEMLGMLGQSLEELAALPYGQTLHPDDREAALKAAASLPPGRTIQGRRLRLKAKDGSWKTIEGNMTNMLEDPDVGAKVTTFRDISENVRLEEMLAHAQKMEAVGRLAGGIAHDFNNIITIISGYGEEALRQMDPGCSERSLVEPMVQAAKRAGALTRQLLAFSRKQVMLPKALNLNQVAEGMGSMVRRLLGADVQISFKLDPGLGLVFMDPSQMEQIIMNLVINSRDAMPSGGSLTIGTSNAHLDMEYFRAHGQGLPGPYVMISISDTGVGMDATTQANIFEPFFTTKELGVGTGLGLSTVYGIVKQCRGSIWVYSEPGVGTTFKIYLPRFEGDQAPSASWQGDIGARGRETILLVEDENPLRELFKIFLSKQGYQVLEAGDAEEALRICREYVGDIQLLLTDMIMPKMNGRELSLKVLGLRPGIRVGYMSGYTNDAFVHQGLLEPGTAFIEKPVGREELLKRVRDLLG